jgi:hypothetical protein
MRACNKCRPIKCGTEKNENSICMNDTVTLAYLFKRLLQADSEGNLIAAEAIKVMKSVIPLTDKKYWTEAERLCTNGNYMYP